MEFLALECQRRQLWIFCRSFGDGCNRRAHPEMWGYTELKPLHHQIRLMNSQTEPGEIKKEAVLVINLKKNKQCQICWMSIYMRRRFVCLCVELKGVMIRSKFDSCENEKMPRIRAVDDGHRCAGLNHSLPQEVIFNILLPGAATSKTFTSIH